MEEAEAEARGTEGDASGADAHMEDRRVAEEIASIRL
jgi:hypothetical protein